MTNLVAQTLSGLPTFCLSILLLILIIKNRKLKVNFFFICASVLTIIQFIYNESFWIGDPTTNSLVNYSKISIIFSPAFIVFLYGALQIVVENNLSIITRKQSLLTLVILSLITLGFYTPFWYLGKYLKHKKESLLIVVFVMSLTYSFFLHTYSYADSDAFGTVILLTVDLLTIALGMALALNLRYTLLRENPEIEINPILTLLFGMFYLQYLINQLNDFDKSIDD